MISSIIRTETIKEFCLLLEQGCNACSLSNNRATPIIYRGNLSAPILLLGESPGLVEEQKGKPFVGPAGQLLDKIFAAINLDTNKDLLLSNVIYCRPLAPEGSGKQNLTPQAEHIKACKPLVEKFIELVKPKIIIACGRIALHSLTNNPKLKISQCEGVWSCYKNTPMFVMTHPASILHKAPWPEEQYKTKAKVWNYMQFFRDTWKDFC